MPAYAPVDLSPTLGYWSSAKKHEVPDGAAGIDSRDMRWNPAERKWRRRYGQTVLGDAFGTLVGILESKWGAKARQMIELESGSFSDGYPAPCVLYTDETDKEGALAFFSTNGADSWQQPYKSYSATHYPTSQDLSAQEHKLIPLWSENGTTLFSRATSIAQRTVMFAGSRRLTGNKDWLLAPNAQGTPLMWNRRFNDATGSGTEVERGRPWGLCPPIHLPRFVTANLPTATTNTRPWKENDQFFFSMTFVDENGEESPPFKPQAKYGTARTGEYVDSFGLVTVPSTTGGTDYYDYLALTQVPIGPYGTRQRRLYRTGKVDSSAAGATPDLSRWYLWEVIDDNTTTTFKSSRGIDAGLLQAFEDPAAGTASQVPGFHFRGIFAPRGKYAWQADGRTFIGDLKPNPLAIILVPTAAPGGTSRENNGDDQKNLGNNWFFYRVYDNAGTRTLQLRYLNAIAGAPVTTSVDLQTGSPTLQDVCDTINATTTASTGGEWAAQVAPGANPQALATNLAYTSGTDFGDDTGFVTDATTGNVRAWNNALWGPLYFTQAYMTALPARPRSFCHTESGPAQKLAGVYGTSMSFAVGPGYDVRPPVDEGPLMGGWPLLDGCVIFYRDAVYLYRNIRGGTTGDDPDYRLVKISNRGCVSPWGITGGNNNAIWPSREGICVTDGTPFGEQFISWAQFNVRTGVGDLAYEIAQCDAASKSGADTARLSCAVDGQSLWVMFRSSASATYNDSVLELPCSMIGASGLHQWLDMSGTAPQQLPWSARLKQAFACVGFVTKSDGRHWYGAVEEATTAYTTGDGRVDEWNTGMTDNGTNVAPVLWTKQMDFGERTRRKRMRRTRWKHKSPTASTTTVTLYRNTARTASTTYTLTATADEFVNEVKRVKLKGQSPSRVQEFKIENDGAGSELFEFWTLEAELRTLATPLT